MSAAFTTTARVLSIRALNESVDEVILEPASYIPYQAGQYLQILSPTHEALFYSIANAPHHSNHYELHIRKFYNAELKNILEQPQLTIKLPFGTCTLTQIDLTRPLLCIAGGTGLAPIKAILEALWKDKPSIPKPTVTVIWAVKSPEDLYTGFLSKLALARETTVKTQSAFVEEFRKPSTAALTYISHIANTLEIENILAYYPEKLLKQSEIILAGPFNMVYTLRDRLVKLGIAAKHMHSDAFSFENQEN